MSSSVTAPYNMLMPDQRVDKYDEDWYKKNIRFIASQWNFMTRPFNKWSLQTNETGLPLGFAEKAFLWRDYYFGTAKNVNYDYILMNEAGGRKSLKMFQGKDIMKFVNYAIEPIIEIAERIPKIMNVTCVSEDVVSKRRFMKDLYKFTVDQQEMTAYMNKNFSAYFQTASGFKFMGDAKKQLSAQDFRESIENGAKNVGIDIYYRNNMKEQLVDLGKDAVLTGVCMEHTKTFNGYTYTARVPIWEAIFPPNVEGDQHRTDPYGGRIRFLTVPQVFAAFPQLGDKEKKEIQDMARNGNTSASDTGWNYYNFVIGCPNFQWWGNPDGVPRIAVVECQWESYSPDDEGKYRKTKREGAMIGNNWLVDYGISPNQTEDWQNPYDTNLNYQVCQPMSVFGINMGIPEILHTYQNEIDFIQTKINEWIAQTKGKFYLLFASKLPPGFDVNQLMSDVSDMRFAVVNEVDGDSGQVTKWLEEGAIEMPTDTIMLMNQIQNYRAMMSDILNIPDAVRGQLGGYQGQKTLGLQLSQSLKGTRYLYDPLNIFFQRIFQKAVDTFKVSSMSNPDFEYNLIVSDTETEIFKSTQQFGLSQYAMYLGFEDIVDDEAKQRIADTILAFAQNSQVTGYALSDYYTIEGMTTNTEIKNYLQYREKEIAEQKAAEAAQQQAIAQQKAAEANKTQQNITAMNNQGADQREAAKIQSKESIEAMKILSDRGSQQQ